MRTNILSTYCPECGYRNSSRTDRKFRKEIRSQSLPVIAWQCESCGKEFLCDKPHKNSYVAS